MLRTILISSGVFVGLLGLVIGAVAVFKDKILRWLRLKAKPVSAEEMRQRAKTAADFLRKRFGIARNPLAIILGTGFGDKLALRHLKSIRFSEIPGFGDLNKLEGHERKFLYGFIGGYPVIVLQGRIHLNENLGNPEIDLMVRLQSQLLMELGATHLIITCGAGALPGSDLAPGDLVLVDGFLSICAPDMPMFTGEFVSPEDILQSGISKVGGMSTFAFPGKIASGCYAMVRGPFFEGRKYDKKALAILGAKVVGMSGLPEACIAAVYHTPVLMLAFVTNGWEEVHQHKDNVAKGLECADALSSFLEGTVIRLSEPG